MIKRKITAIFLLLAVTTVQLSAQRITAKDDAAQAEVVVSAFPSLTPKGTNSVSLSLAGPTLFNTAFMFSDKEKSHLLYDKFASDGKEGMKDFTPMFGLSLEGDRSFSDTFSAGVDLHLQRFGARTQMTDSLGTVHYRGRHECTAVAVMPKATLQYRNWRNFGLYGEVEMGVSIFSYDCIGTKFGFAFQATPIGIFVGRNIYGFAELGIGTVWTGLQMGVGYRFKL